MFSKSTLFGTLVGFLFFYLIGWLFYDSLAADYFEAHRVNMMMGGLNMFYLTLGSLIQAYVLSVLYGRWCDCDRSIRSGFCFGAWMGAFVGFWHGTDDVRHHGICGPRSHLGRCCLERVLLRNHRCQYRLGL